METSSADFEQRFFAGAEKITLHIEVLKETYADIQCAIQRNGWDTDEGLRILLTLGLGYAQGQQLLESDDPVRARLADRLTNLESVSAAMKFRTFSFMRDNQVLEMRMGALQNAKAGLEAVVQRLRPERDALKQEVQLLQAQVQALQSRVMALEAGSSEPLRRSGIVDCLRNLRIRLRRSGQCER